MRARPAPPRLLFAIVVTAVVSAMLAACGGSSKSSGDAANAGKQPASAARGDGTAEGQAFQPVLASSELLVGADRFSLGILDGATGAPLPDAKVHFRFFEVHGNQGVPRFEADAVFRAPAREAGLATAIQHRHPDGTVHVHSNAEADVGVYTAQVTFDKAGTWGVEAQIAVPDGRQGVVRLPFDVVSQTKMPIPGQVAPRSRQPTIHDADIAQIDSSADPDPALHDITIADAIASGKPTLVIFASPGYCSSRICGPSVEIVKKLMPKYAGRVNFIHVEVYKDFTKLTPSDTFEEWHLSSEPWFFIIDGKGIISTRFDGPTTLEELDGALAQVTG